MKTIEFKGKSYDVPECWCQITLRQVIKVQELSDILEEAPLIAIIAGYTDIPVEELKISNARELEPVLDCLEFIYEDYKVEPTNTFTFSGRTYSTKIDIADINFEDWVSVQAILYNNRDYPTKGLARVIAVLCKQEGETLDSINLDEREKLFMDLPMPIVKDIEGFFLSSLLVYRGISQLSSIIQEEEKLVRYTLKELSNMVSKRREASGLTFYMRFQTLIFRIYLWYLNFVLERYFRSGHSKRSKRNYKWIWKKYHTMMLRGSRK